ncbi:MAG: PQ-loop repeat-containing protein [Alphaproteobacteria bacterium]|nr:PQ-loop repeat-containing protein [Alphaproteobacteria bacterium]
MQEFIGLLGSICFAFSSWPQAYLSYKTQSAKGVKWSFLWLWIMGSVFSSIYATATDKLVLLPNYICGGAGALIVLVIKISETFKQTDMSND